MTKVVYITGCLGFIGSYVTRLCLKQGWYVRGIDKQTYAANLYLLQEFKKYPKFIFEQIDINDIPFLYDCDYVINVAAETHVANSIVSSNEFIHSNINGVHHLLELIRNGREDHKPILLHFSTDEVYGDIEHGAHKETDLLKPSNPYSATKAASDMLILAWSRTYGIKYVIVRPTNNYGIGQYVEKLIPRAIKYLLLGRKIPLHNKGKPIRNWLHASDTANAVMTIINTGVVNEIFNVSGHFEQANIDTVRKIIECLRLKGPIEDYIIDNERPGQDVRYAIDDSKLMKFGWAPQAVFDKELPSIVRYYKKRFVW
jgi:dTDP-glucose 4,6-dehydratase